MFLLHPNCKEGDLLQKGSSQELLLFKADFFVNNSLNSTGVFSSGQVRIVNYQISTNIFKIHI